MNKIDTYWKFDIEKFIRDYPENKARLKDLKEGLKEVAGTRSPDFTSPARTPGRGDSVSGAVRRIEKAEAEIPQYVEVVDRYEQAYAQLTEAEKMVIRYFFHEPGQVSSHVRFLANTLNYERTQVYKCRRKAVKKMGKIIGV